MTADFIVRNLGAWSAQVLVIAAAGAALSLLVRHPRARLALWHAVLLAAVILPVAGPWKTPIRDVAANATVSISTGPVFVNEATGTIVLPTAVEILLGLWIAGFVIRLVWLGIGLWRLESYPRVAIEPPVDSDRAWALWYRSSAIHGPASYGRSILLPARFEDLPADARRAIAMHELEHVARRDWLFVLAEEIVRAILWFHPAVWWALAQINLAREQAVDLAVVAATRDRQSYLEALVGEAEASLAPATAFLRKRHLTKRVTVLLKEVRMSRSKAAAAITAVACTAVAAVWLFPLQAPAQEPDASGIEVKSAYTILHRPALRYPSGYKAAGDVVVEIAVNSKGEVVDARVVSGPEDLRRTALTNVFDWHISTSPAPPARFEVAIRFGADPSTVSKTLRPPASPRTTAAGTGRLLKDIDLTGVPAELRGRITERLPVRAGDTVAPEAMDRVAAALAEVDSHLISIWRGQGSDGLILRVALNQPRVAGGVPGGVPGGVVGGVVGGVPGETRSAQTKESVEIPQRIKVGGTVQEANVIRKVAPEYPALARQARIQGVVRFTVTISKEGSVTNLELVSGHPLLVPAAQEAVQQWQYRPTLLNGAPVEVITSVDINFTLAGEIQ